MPEAIKLVHSYGVHPSLAINTPLNRRRWILSAFGAVAGGGLLHETHAAFPGEVRQWTMASGQSFEAMAAFHDGTNLFLRRTNGQVFPMPLTTLSEADQAYAEEWKEFGLDLRNTRWPSETTIDRYVKLEGGPEIFQSPHFEYRCDTRVPTVMIQTFAKVFEGTFEALRQLPLGLVTEEDMKVRGVVEVFAEYQNYMAGGGLPGSAGTFSLTKGVIYLPMELVGMRRTPSGAMVRSQERGDMRTLIHEVTHQIMRRWIPVLPIWFTEGFAEYISATPYAEGKFSFSGIDNGILGMLRDSYGNQGRGLSKYPVAHPEVLFDISHQQWNQLVASDPTASQALYSSAMLMVYFFLNLDSKKDPLAVLAYLQSSRFFTSGDRRLVNEQGIPLARTLLLRGRTYDQLWTEMQRAYAGKRIITESIINPQRA